MNFPFPVSTMQGANKYFRFHQDHFLFSSGKQSKRENPLCSSNFVAFHSLISYFHFVGWICLLYKKIQPWIAHTSSIDTVQYIVRWTYICFVSNGNRVQMISMQLLAVYTEWILLFFYGLYFNFFLLLPLLPLLLLLLIMLHLYQCNAFNKGTCTVICRRWCRKRDIKEAGNLNAHSAQRVL